MKLFPSEHYFLPTLKVLNQCRMCVGDLSVNFPFIIIIVVVFKWICFYSGNDQH